MVFERALVLRVDQIPALDTVQVTLVHRVHPPIAGLACRVRLASFPDRDADRPDLVEAAPQGTVDTVLNVISQARV